MHGSFVSFSGRCNSQDDSICMLPELCLSVIHYIFLAMSIQCQGLGVLSGLLISLFNHSHLLVKGGLKIVYFNFLLWKFSNIPKVGRIIYRIPMYRSFGFNNFQQLASLALSGFPLPLVIFKANARHHINSTVNTAVCTPNIKRILKQYHHMDIIYSIRNMVNSI